MDKQSVTVPAVGHRDNDRAMVVHKRDMCDEASIKDAENGGSIIVAPLTNLANAVQAPYVKAILRAYVIRHLFVLHLDSNLSRSVRHVSGQRIRPKRRSLVQIPRSGAAVRPARKSHRLLGIEPAMIRAQTSHFQTRRSITHPDRAVSARLHRTAHTSEVLSRRSPSLMPTRVHSRSVQRVHPRCGLLESCELGRSLQGCSCLSWE